MKQEVTLYAVVSMMGGYPLPLFCDLDGRTYIFKSRAEAENYVKNMSDVEVEEIVGVGEITLN